jgi:hypothetical protein
MKRYFDVLGLPINANQQQIKKHYRKLAMRLHPDKNPSPEAKALFIKITEAYDFLSKQTQDQPGITSDRKKEKSREERIKEAQIRFYNQQQKERLENERYFQSLFKGKKWQLIKGISFPALIIACLLIIDLVLANKFSATKIINFKKEQGLSQNNYHFTGEFTTTTNETYFLKSMDYSLLNSAHDIQVEHTFVFHLPVKIHANQGKFYSTHDLIFNFYWGIFPLICILLLPFLVRYFRFRTAFYTLLYYVTLYLTPTILAFFLLSDDHWAHLLTLGFL